jgi:hypothetical protein
VGEPWPNLRLEKQQTSNQSLVTIDQNFIE